MTKVEDYVSGKILEDAEIMLKAINAVRLPLIGGYIGKKLLEKIEKFDPMQITVDEASELIKNSNKVAIGPRVCFTLHNRDFAESVFLAELAEGLVNAGKARYTTDEEAINMLMRYSRRNPIVASKVSGEIHGDMLFIAERLRLLEYGKEGVEVFEENQKFGIERKRGRLCLGITYTKT